MVDVGRRRVRRAARPRAGRVRGRSTSVACSAARETFALFDADLAPLGPGILWSDHRARRRGRRPRRRRRVPARDRRRALAAACAVAKVAWVARPRARRVRGGALAPRAARPRRGPTHRRRSSPTRASRRAPAGTRSTATPRGDEPLAARLPDVVPSTQRDPARRPSAWSAALGLPATRGGRARRGRPGLRGARHRRPDRLPDGLVGHDGQRLGAPSRARRRAAHRGAGVAHRRRRVPRRGRPRRGGIRVRLARRPHRTVASATLWDAAAVVPAGARRRRPRSRGSPARVRRTGAPTPPPRSPGCAPTTLPPSSPARSSRASRYDVARSLELLDPGGTELVVTGGGAANPTWRAVARRGHRPHRRRPPPPRSGVRRRAPARGRARRRGPRRSTR